MAANRLAERAAAIASTGKIQSELVRYCSRSIISPLDFWCVPVQSEAFQYELGE